MAWNFKLLVEHFFERGQSLEIQIPDYELWWFRQPLHTTVDRNPAPVHGYLLLEIHYLQAFWNIPPG